LVKVLALDTVYINAGPKIFAARIGLIISGLIILTGIVKLNILANSFAGILGLFSFLEAAFGYCVACKIYPIVYNHLYKS
jgi:hypothetical protein